MTNPIAFSLQNLSTSTKSLVFINRFSIFGSRAVPAFQGATKTLDTDLS